MEEMENVQNGDDLDSVSSILIVVK